MNDPPHIVPGLKVLATEFEPHIPQATHFGGTPAIRVVVTASGPIVELADGRDSLGETRWVKALVIPDRRGLGEQALEGWKEISQALGCSVRSAVRYARQRLYPLPVMYGLKGPPYIARSLLRAWLTARSTAEHPTMKVVKRRKAKRGDKGRATSPEKKIRI